MMSCCKKPFPAKIKSIAEGWKNYLFSNKEAEKIAIQRAEICINCEFNKLNICTSCGCWIPAKTRSLSEECKFWNNV